MGKNELLQHAVLLPLPDGERAAVVEVDGLPEGARGLCMERGAGLYVVCINASLSEDQKTEVFLHELSHVLLGHLTNRGRTVKEKELEANAAAADLLGLLERGGDSFEISLLREWKEKHGQVVPLRA